MLNFNQKDKIFFGKIEGIDDLVTFEGKSVDELEKSFHEAVNDYLDLCRQIGKEPHKSFSGSFNVRINPKLHAQAYKIAKLMNMSLNQYFSKVIEKSLSERIDI